jgi:hypothetical protein
MLNLLNQIDIYGTSFNFTTFKQRKYNTKLGGVFTLLTIGFSLALFLVFGRPVWKKQNPNVIVQTTDLPSYPQYKIETSKFPISFRFENEKRQILDLGTYMYPYLQYIKQVKNDTTGNMDTVFSTVVNTIPCIESKISQMKTKTLSNTLTGWQCADFDSSNIELGGLYDNGNKYINYFKITIFYCKYNGVEYSECTDYDKLNSLLNGKTKIYMSVMVPDVATTPQDPEQPLSVTATNLFFTLNPLLMRTDRYYYRYVTVRQDLGWFFEDYKNFDGYTMERRDTDIQMRTIEDYKNPSTIKTIATAVFFTNNKVEQTQVNFQKISLVLANTGGIIKLVTSVFSIINFFLCNHMMFFYLVNEMYDFDLNRKEGTMLKFVKLKDTRATYEISNSPTIDPKNPIKMLVYDFNNQHGRETGQPQEIYSTQRNVSEPLHKDDIQAEMKNKQKNDKWISNLYKEKLTRKKKSKYKIPLNVIMKKLCCNCDSQNLVSKLYFYGEGLLRQRLDILYYLKNINKLERFSQIMLNTEQNHSLNYIRNKMIKPDDLEEELNKTNKRLKKKVYHEYNRNEIISIINYFKNKTNKSEIDMKLTCILDNDILDIIKEE